MGQSVKGEKHPASNGSYEWRTRKRSSQHAAIYKLGVIVFARKIDCHKLRCFEARRQAPTTVQTCP